MNRAREMGDRLAEIEGDRDYRTLEENEGRGAEGNITREDLLMEQTESLVESEGDTDDQTLEENKGRADEGNLTREDLLMEQTEKLAEGEGDTGNQTPLEENEGREAEGNKTLELFKEHIEHLAESTEDTDDQTMEENEESLAESEGDTNHQTLDENQGRPAEGNRTFEDLLKEQLGPFLGFAMHLLDPTVENTTERFAVGEGDTGNQTLEENEGRPAEGDRRVEDLLKEQLEMLTGMERILDRFEVDAGDASEWQLRTTNLMKEQIKQVLGTARQLADRTLENTTGETDDWKELEDMFKRQIDILDTVREIDDPAVKDIKGTSAEWMEPMTDVFKEQLDRLAVLKEKENPTEEDNEGNLPHMMGILEDLVTAQINMAPCMYRSIDDIKDTDFADALMEVQLNVHDMKRSVTESVAFAEMILKDLPGLPPEIRRMDKRSQNLFREALEAGKEKVYNIRLMLVGHLGVGKTTLAKRILGEEVKEAPHVSTEGIEVHPRCVKIDINTKEWIVEGTEHRFPDTSQLLVNMITQYVAHKSKNSTDGDNQVRKKENTEQEEIDSFATGGAAVSASSKPNIHEKNTVIYRRQGDTGINKNTSQGDTGINKNTSNLNLHTFVTKYRTRTHSETVFCYVTMLDFAGQFGFYSTHQAFMSWRTLYLLVTDMSKGLDDVVKDDKCSMTLNSNLERSIKDYAVFWLNSILSHGKRDEASPQCEGRKQQETGNHEQDHRREGKYPPVILVATHSDKVPGGENEETKEEYFDAVRMIVKESPLRFLLRGNFAFSNFGPETDIDALKKKIVELAEQQEYWGEEIPGSWLALEHTLMELKRRGIKIIEYSRVEEINSLSDVKIENPEEMEVFLRFEHDLGNIVFFPTRKLREKVVLDPEWLMDGVKILISPPRYMREDPDIYPRVHSFKETGRLAKPLIGSIWSVCEDEDFHKNQDHLLDLLEKLSIIAKSVEQDGSVEKEYYWVPCVIYKPAPDHVKNPKLYEGMTKTSTLCFESTTKFVHVGVFHRLVASFLSKWKPARKEEGGEYHLYHGCCVFDVDQCHNLLLAQNDYVILATMFRYSSRGEYPDNELCNTVRKLISSTLADITTCICPNSTFDICVKCEKSSTDTIKGLHRITDTTEKRCTCIIPNHPVNVESLLKFWEVGPKQSEMAYEDSEYNNQEELHRTVLRRCLSQLLKDLDFESVFLSILQKGFFDEVTMRDIKEQETTSKKIMALIERIMQGGPKAYEMFRECLVQTKQTNLLQQLSIKRQNSEPMETAAESVTKKFH